MTLDHERQRVLVVFRSPPKFAAFNWQTGDVVTEVDTCGDADDLFLDAKRKLIYITCGTGFIDVLRADDSKYSRLTRIPTVVGAPHWNFCPRHGSLVFRRTRSSWRAAFHLDLPGDALNTGCNHACEVGSGDAMGFSSIFVRAHRSS